MRACSKVILIAGASVGLAACSDGESDENNTAPTDAGQTTYTRQELLDPETCKECHPVHYDQWSGSMHAYAADDPVFLAMNARGQTETDGALGDFCVNCHAPMAVLEGATEDGLNLDEVPKHLKGVTCYFCHNVDRVEGTHNNPLILANDTTMRGGIGREPGDAPPAPNPAHQSAYSPHVDGKNFEGATMCGACHDIVTEPPIAPARVHLERTFAEWKDTLYASGDRTAGALTCSDCHAKRDAARETIAEFEGVPGGRRFHRHDFEGIDLALTDFPNRERQRILVERQLATTIAVQLCVSQTGAIQVLLDNAGAGHAFPSGATQDRRAWVELVASRIEADGAETVLYQSGVVENGQPVVEIDDPDLWLFRDRALGADGSEVHMFWDIADQETNLIPGIRTFSPLGEDFHIEQVDKLFEGTLTLGTIPDRVTVRVRVRPMGFDVLGDLQNDPGLSESAVGAMPTLDVLPNRCYERAVRERHPDLLPQTDKACDPEADSQRYVVVWTPEAGRETGVTTELDTTATCVLTPGIL